MAAIAAAGATHVSPIVLHLRPGAREWWQAWLRREHPDLLPRYASSTAPPTRPRTTRTAITEKVHALADRYGVGRTNVLRRRTGHERAKRARPQPPTVEQSRDAVQLELI